VSVTVRLPPVLRTVMDGAAGLAGEGTTIEEVLNHLARAHPALGLHLFDEAGMPRRNIICLHDGAVVRSRDFAQHLVRNGDELVMTNLLAGG
jgi:hypothetical protein